MMASELKIWNAADYLSDEEDVEGYLRETLLSAYPGVYGTALDSASRARGGIAVVSQESGVPEQDITQAISNNDDRSLSVLQRVQKGYEHSLQLRRVA